METDCSLSVSEYMCLGGGPCQTSGVDLAIGSWAQEEGRTEGWTGDQPLKKWQGQERKGHVRKGQSQPEAIY